MVKVASELGRRQGAEALVTGDSLGQVASQTLPNLALVEDAAELPLLRPLIDRDKSEIVEIAKQLGTYEISILPDEDCCSLFRRSRRDARQTTTCDASSARRHERWLRSWSPRAPHPRLERERRSHPPDTGTIVWREAPSSR